MATRLSRGTRRAEVEEFRPAEPPPGREPVRRPRRRGAARASRQAAGSENRAKIG